VRFLCKRSSDRDSLLLTARELGWIARATIAEPEPIEQIARVA
jgi:hypothetical protein